MKSVRRSSRAYYGSRYCYWTGSGANDGAVLKQPPYNSNHCNGTIGIDYSGNTKQVIKDLETRITS